ncbi:MAG: type IV pilus assembly protein PilM [Planctomycetaceae bacterium]|nr:type IV pilus assembly protein PilM [Planctomycetaceae bacterium]
MAEARGVWGIDIGQAGLKAIRLRYAEAADQVIAVAFDYVPHPKILSQPDAVAEELIPQALETFLSRNDIQGDQIAISVPGQTALARFIQLPPVQSNKVAEIVKYEARQQIPFDLDDVIWDYQTLGGGMQEGDFLLEAEVGLFAMKRDQVQQQLRPFLERKVEVELVQIAPLGLFNFLTYDVLGLRGQEAPADSSEYSIVLDMGADNTMLLVSNGAKIWIRNVPIGGNHFTRALTKEMKLTFAKAEHLKCNATKSPDPRAVFQALRPVFNDYVSEIQRSIGYFSSVNRDATITKVLGMGNGFKLAGLQKFLQQNLQYDVERVETFQALAGDNVLNAPLFQENILSFAVPYGLALQTLGRTSIHTTLLPPEIRTARMIRRKKPWAVLTASALLAFLSISAVGYSTVWSSVSPDRWKEAEAQVSSLKSTVSGFNSQYQAQGSTYEETIAKGDQLVNNADTRLYWLEVYRAINECLPRDTGDALDEMEITRKNRIRLWSITAERKSDLKTWFDQLDPNIKESSMRPDDQANPPSGPGYVFTLEGVHYHNDKNDPTMRDVLYVNKTLLDNLNDWQVQQPTSTAPVPVGKIGISHAAITSAAPAKWIPFDPEAHRAREKGRDDGGGNVFGRPRRRGFGPGAGPDAIPGLAAGPVPGGVPGGPDDAARKPVQMIPETRFTVQFAWQPIPPDERTDARPKPEAGAAAAAGPGAGPGQSATPAPGGPAMAPGMPGDPALADPAAMPVP